MRNIFFFSARMGILYLLYDLQMWIFSRNIQAIVCKASKLKMQQKHDRKEWMRKQWHKMHGFIQYYYNIVLFLGHISIAFNFI